MGKSVHIKGVYKKELDINLIHYVLFLEGKRIVRERRQRDARNKLERRKRDASSEDRRGHDE